MIHEYAGFKYTITFDSTGKAVSAWPVPGQHGSAAKGQHTRAALESYLADAGRFDEVRASLRSAAASARRLADIEPTTTRWRSPHSPKLSVGDLTGSVCPSCDEPIILSTTGPMCPHCGAR